MYVGAWNIGNGSDVHVGNEHMPDVLPPLNNPVNLYTLSVYKVVVQQDCDHLLITYR